MKKEKKQKIKTKRSIIFRVLCYLSMGGGFLGVFIGILSIIDLDLINVLNINRIPGYTTIKSLTWGSDAIYPYLKIVLYGASFTGALLMLMKRRRGIYFYTIAQGILLIIPYLTWNLKPIVVFFTDLPDMIFTIAFIAAYWIYYSEIDFIYIKPEELNQESSNEESVNAGNVK
ncbi:MAG: hypothetical protein C0592_01315 [Marinilabiliales bacterium]|nr:MAG: hypothetical protein C0592_01315 [Marinilabiliales bacterium]